MIVTKGWKGGGKKGRHNEFFRLINASNSD